VRTAHGRQRNVLLKIGAVFGVRCGLCWLASHGVNPPNQEKDHKGDYQEAYHCIDESPVINRRLSRCLCEAPES